MPSVFKCYNYRLSRYLLSICIVSGFIFFLFSKHAEEDYNNALNVQGFTSRHYLNTSVLLSYVHRKCSEHDIRTKWNNSYNTDLFPKAFNIVLPQHKILYVSNPKTGSTSFMKFINRLDGDTRPYEEMVHVHRQRNRLNYKYYKSLRSLSDAELLGRQLFVVGFVRNPLIRLVSGFRDKVIRRESYRQVVDRQVVDGMLTEEYEEEEEEEKLKFRRFVKMLTTGRIPDAHFTAQWKRMEICSFPYNLLGQTESTGDSISTMMRATGMRGIEYPGSRMETGQDVESSTEKAVQLLESLTAGELRALYKFYEMDFELLGYTKFGHPNFPYIDLNQ